MIFLKTRLENFLELFVAKKLCNCTAFSKIFAMKDKFEIGQKCDKTVVSRFSTLSLRCHAHRHHRHWLNV